MCVLFPFKVYKLNNAFYTFHLNGNLIIENRKSKISSTSTLLWNMILPIKVLILEL
jgi:hypothetical protein